MKTARLAGFADATITPDLADEAVHPGDYVLNHVGFVIRRIPAEDVQTTLDLNRLESGRDLPVIETVAVEPPLRV